MNIRVKLLLFSMVLVLGVIGGSSTLFFVTEKNLILQKEQEKQETIARGLSEVAREAVVSSNDILALNYIQQLLKGQPEIAQAYVIDLKGKILAHSEISLIGEKDTSPATPKALEAQKVLFQDQVLEGKQILDIAYPVRDGASHIGVARVVLKKSYVEREIEDLLKPLRNRILMVSVLSLLVGVGLSLLFAYPLGNRIRLLAEGAASIGAGKLDTQISIKSKDELGALAQEFNAMASRLRLLDEMKQDFVSGVTNELKPSLAVLSENIKLFTEGNLGKLTHDQTESLRKMDENTKRLLYFTNDLMALAKIEGGRMTLTWERVDVAVMSQEILQWLGGAAKQKDIHIVTDFTNNLSKVVCDPEHSKRVLANLVSNAIKFTPEKGKVTLVGKNSGEFVQISVKDTGVGMPQDVLTTIFDKFAQIKRTKETSNSKGTGLRLAIVKGIVEAQGGKIWAESKLGNGSTFHFTLPKYTAS